MFELPTLNYDYNALDPHIDPRTMEIHHSKHHAGYVTKLNAAIEGQNLENKSIEEILQNLDNLPAEIQTAVRNNGGGHYNHTLFWSIMSPDGGGEPTGPLAEAINKTFDSFEAFQTEFTNAAATRFGSGWAWLTIEDGELHVCSTPNQDSPIMEGNTPILGIDVWEHAYYLHYQNKRPDYITAWWHVVNWDQVAKNFTAATK